MNFPFSQHKAAFMLSDKLIRLKFIRFTLCENKSLEDIFNVIMLSRVKSLFSLPKQREGNCLI